MEDGQKLLESCSHLPGSLFGEEMKENSLRITWDVRIVHGFSFALMIGLRCFAASSGT